MKIKGHVGNEKIKCSSLRAQGEKSSRRAMLFPLRNDIQMGKRRLLEYYIGGDESKKRE